MVDPKKLEIYIKSLKTQELEIGDEIASKERSLSRIRAKLQNPEKYLAQELGRGSVKVKRALGEDMPSRPKTVLKKNVKVDSSEVSEKSEVPAPAPAPEEKKEKSKWSFFE